VNIPDTTQNAERRLTLEDGLARLARIDMVFRIPPGSSPDSDALGVLATILSSGRSARFYESIVREKQLANGVSAYASQSRGPGLFRIGATVLPGKTLTDLEAAIDTEIERMKTDPIAAWEIEKARTSARRSFVSSRGGSLDRAIELSQDALFWNQPNRINTQEERIAGVTAADVQRVARRYLVKASRTVVLTVPKAAPPQGGR
jgi:predicted Zn-dependent peptidase